MEDAAKGGRARAESFQERRQTAEQAADERLVSGLAKALGHARLEEPAGRLQGHHRVPRPGMPVTIGSDGIRRYQPQAPGPRKPAARWAFRQASGPPRL